MTKSFWSGRVRRCSMEPVAAFQRYTACPRATASTCDRVHTSRERVRKAQQPTRSVATSAWRSGPSVDVVPVCIFLSSLLINRPSASCTMPQTRILPSTRENASARRPLPTRIEITVAGQGRRMMATTIIGERVPCQDWAHDQDRRAHQHVHRTGFVRRRDP